jgi:AraC family transcriptional regulator, regulatory protein of adaptative response / DNA-3-methyladenine glycosylase II
MGVSSVWIPATEPFDGRSVVGFLRARAVAGVEEVTNGSYRRNVSFKNGSGVVSVRPKPGGVQADLDLEDPADADEAVARIRRLFDLDTDPGAIAAVLGSDPLLGPLVRGRPGLRVPGAMDGYELAVRAIVGQQVSVAGARTVLGRLVARFGGWPTPELLAGSDPAGFPFPRARGAALVELARMAAAGDLRLEPDVDLAETRSLLLAIPGVGPWTVSYIGMRALGDRDAFLPGDVAVRRALERLGGEPDHDRWRPWRSYAVMHLWRSLDS